jgi:uncharacterized protein YggE
MRRITTSLAVAFTLTRLLADLPSASAQATPPGAIQATGQHEIKLAPQKLRLSLAIRAEGTDAKNAIEAFVKHKERVKKELVEMKAEESTIDISTPRLMGSMAGMPQVMPGTTSIFGLQAVPPPVPGESRPEGLPKVYTAVAQVTAEWALPTTDADALAMLPETLKEQIAARDLMGQKNKVKLDSVQQEKIEELQTMVQQTMSYAMSTGEGQPFTVQFVAKVDDETRTKVMRAAYERAVATAKILAAAAGFRLGELVSIRCDEAPSTGTNEVVSPYAAFPSVAGAPAFKASSDVAISADPGGLRFGVTVDVAFAKAK